MTLTFSLSNFLSVRDWFQAHLQIRKECAHPKISPGEIVRIFKSITAREIFRRHPEIKKELWGGEFWPDGYYVATVGERGNWSKVENYIQKQGKPKEDLRQIRLF
jgi:putative transposase